MICLFLRTYFHILVVNFCIFVFSLVEYTCHESGASAIAFSTNRQRLLTGGRRGELCILGEEREEGREEKKGGERKMGGEHGEGGGEGRGGCRVVMTTSL